MKRWLALIVGALLVVVPIVLSPAQQAAAEPTDDQAPVDTTVGAAAESPTPVIEEAQPTDSDVSTVPMATVTDPETQLAAHGEQLPSTPGPTDEPAPTRSTADPLPVPTDGKVVETATVSTDDRLAIAGATWTSGTDVEVFYRMTTADGATESWTAVEAEDAATSGVATTGTEPLVLEPNSSVQIATVSSTTAVAPEVMLVQMESSPADTMATATTTRGTPPPIHTRADWGADESLVSGSPTYAQVQGAVIHHTAGQNSYSPEQVPQLLRGILSYHTKGLGWSDIGYNVIVDKYGRAWEGRRGGLAQAVQGAHAIGINHHTFGVSLMGTYSNTQPSSAAIDTISRVIAWKFAIHGVPTHGSTTTSSGKVVAAISGHRDSSATTCPGDALYAYLGTIRSRVNTYRSQYLTVRNFNRDLTGDNKPDLVVRQGTKVSVANPYGGGSVSLGWTRGLQVGNGWLGAQNINAGDFNSDRTTDLVRILSDGKLMLYGGTSAGGWMRPQQIGHGWTTVELVSGGFDWNGDGRPDILARDKKTKQLRLYPGNGAASFGRAVTFSGTYSNLRTLAFTPRFDGTNAAAVGTTATAGEIVVIRRSGSGLAAPRTQQLGIGTITAVMGFNDINGDGHGDVMLRTSDGRLYLGTPNSSGQLSVVQVGAGWNMMRDILPTADIGVKQRLHAVGTDGLLYRYTFTATGGSSSRQVLTIASTDKKVINAGRWNADAYPDLLVIKADGSLMLHAGTGPGSFQQTGTKVGQGWAGFTDVTAVGDFGGTGKPSLVTLSRSTGALVLYEGNGRGGFTGTKVVLDRSAKDIVRITAAGLMMGHTAPDILGVDAAGGLHLFDGSGLADMWGRRKIGQGWAPYAVLGGGPFLNPNDYQPSVLAVDGQGKAWVYPTSNGGKVGARQSLNLTIPKGAAVS